MDIVINEDELRLLAWMQKEAQGYGPLFGISAAHAWRELGFSQGQSASMSPQGMKALSYLIGWGLADHTEAAPKLHDSMYMFCLTAAGENYMRTLKQRLDEQGIGSQVKAGFWQFIKETGATVKQAIFKAAGEVLAEMIKSGLR